MEIYLNFDGVLHPDQVFYETGCMPSLLALEHSALEHAELLATTLERYVDVQIVLNTWWTFYLGLDACKDLLPSSLAARVIGSTVQHASTYDAIPVRFREAERYIARQPTRGCLVLDHSNARYRREFLPHLLLLEPDEGLGNRSARRTLERRLDLSEREKFHAPPIT
ncbi:HAD domain-containing protein [Paraburkholderia sediminicola]|uniref:HAD domain-containing protein n=1 Tax=Paraburkholderia sediminicola TaxID=458836 RepID=UPI0038BCCF58